MSYRNGSAFSCPANVVYLRLHFHDIPVSQIIQSSYLPVQYNDEYSGMYISPSLMLPCTDVISGGSRRIQQLYSEKWAECCRNVYRIQIFSHL